MAITIPKLEKISLLAGKLETTNGTAISLAGTDADHIIYNAAIVPDDSSIARPQPGGMGSDKSIAGEQTCTCTFQHHLTGKGASGAVPPWADRFLPACGYTKTSTTFNRAASGQTITLGLYEDGLLRLCYGAVGNFRLLYSQGQPAIADYTFRGLYAAITDVAIISPTYPTVLPPIFAGATIAVGAFTPVLSAMEVDAGNEIVMRPDAAVSASGGLRCGLIVDHAPTMKLDPEASAIATRDWLAVYKAHTEESWSIAIGADANNIVTVSGSKAQTQMPKRGSRNKILTDEIMMQLNSTTPLAIAFT